MFIIVFYLLNDSLKLNVFEKKINKRLVLVYYS